MAERIMKDRYALDVVRPRTWEEKRVLLVFVASMIATFLFGVGLYKLLHASQLAREQHWINAQGTIEAVRAGAIAGQNGGYQSAMVYNEEVLVTYSVNGFNERRWISVGRAARQGNISFDAVRWKGRHCLVLINPKNSEQVQLEFQQN